MSNFCKNCGRKITTGSVCSDCSSTSKKVVYSSDRPGQTVDGPSLVANSEIFFNISAIRLVVLSVLTFGIYDLYWFYKNWSYIEDFQNKKISSLGRAIFTIFYCYSLFSEIAKKAISYGYKNIFPGWLSFFYIIVAIIARGIGRIDSSQIAESEQLTMGLIGILILFLNVIPLYFVQKAINFTNEKNGNIINKKFTTGEVFFIIISIIVVIIYILI